MRQAKSHQRTWHTSRYQRAADRHPSHCGYPRPCRTKDNGINGMTRASHRQNYVIPPRKNRSFPLVELLK